MAFLMLALAGLAVVVAGPAQTLEAEAKLDQMTALAAIMDGLYTEQRSRMVTDCYDGHLEYTESCTDQNISPATSPNPCKEYACSNSTFTDETTCTSNGETWAADSNKPDSVCCMDGYVACGSQTDFGFCCDFCDYFTCTTETLKGYAGPKVCGTEDGGYCAIIGSLCLHV